MDKLVVTILAGGLGKRMNTNAYDTQNLIPKVLHMVNSKPMIIRIIEVVTQLNPIKIIIVVGKFYEQIKNSIESYIKLDNIEFAFQEIPIGTGDAIKNTLHLIDDNVTNIILNGDTPLLKFETLKEIYDTFNKNKNKLQLTCINLENPTGNGRILMDDQNNFVKIVEEKDCSEDERKIKLTNCGIYLVNGAILKKYIPLIKNNNVQNEYYLPDIAELYKNGENEIVSLFVLDKNKEIEMYNINTREQLNFVNSLKI